MSDLKAYTDLLLRWNKRINLVSDGDEQSLWQRHILDSLQILQHAPAKASSWLDLGSGAGLPGLVCAITAREKRPLLNFTLVDADLRKTAFLRDCVHRLDLDISIESARIEDLRDATYDVISARAFAPLDRLLEYGHRFCNGTTCFLLHKGARCDEEITAARHHWLFRHELFPSISDATGTILKLSELRLRDL